MDIVRHLGISLLNQAFSMPIFKLQHFPNSIFFFKINKLSVLFNVLELKMLFHYLDYSFSMFTCFCPFSNQRRGLIFLNFSSQPQLLPWKRFSIKEILVTFCVLQALEVIFIYKVELILFPFFFKAPMIVVLMHSIQAEKQCVLLKRKNTQPQRCFSLLLHLQYIL